MDTNVRLRESRIAEIAGGHILGISARREECKIAMNHPLNCRMKKLHGRARRILEGDFSIKTKRIDHL